MENQQARRGAAPFEQPAEVRESDVALLRHLHEALAKPGCGLCRLVERAVRIHIFTLYYDLAMDTGVRDDLRESRGLCREHLWLAVEMERQRHGAGGGLAVILEDVLNAIQARIDKSAAEDASQAWRAAWPWHLASHHFGSPVDEAIHPRRPCSACAIRDQTSSLFCGTLARYADQPAIREALASSWGLCLPHWGGVITAAPTHTCRHTLLGLQQVKARAVLHDLQTALQAGGVHTANEAWIRAMELLVGRGHRLDAFDADVIGEWQRAWSEELAHFRQNRGVLWRRGEHDEAPP